MIKSKRHSIMLAPCPRCRQQPLMIVDLAGNQYHFGCEPCRFHLPELSTEQEAVGLWEFVAVGAVRFYPLPAQNPV